MSARGRGSRGARPAAAGSAEVLRALSDPATYGTTGPVERHETHASWVFLAGAWAYKVKKPVKLAFLDYSTLARRRAACHEEIGVNRELGGDVYDGVCAIVPAGAGLALGEEHDPRAVEYAVRMRRFEQSRTLQGLIDAQTLEPAQLDAVAALLASFHERAPVVHEAEPAALLARWQRNLDELEAIVDPARWRLHLAREFAHAFISAHVETLNARLRAGCVRDGHGDLRCEHVLLEGDVRVVDRIEFDPRLRRLDAGADLAFLAMDLEANGRADAAARLLASYRSAGGDPGGDALLAFHACYWALVRAKVAVLAARAPGQQARLQEAERLRDLAERLRWRTRGRLALIVSGPPASGKSTLAAELARRSGAETVSSDEVRKRLAGLAASERARPEHYSAAFTRRTYAAVGERAAELLRAGQSAIVDATCRTAKQRAALVQALGGDAERLLLIHCRVSAQTAGERARGRMADPQRVSDATPPLAERLGREFEPPRELAAELVLELDAEAPVERRAGEVELALDRRVAASGGAGATT